MSDRGLEKNCFRKTHPLLTMYKTVTSYSSSHSNCSVPWVPEVLPCSYRDNGTTRGGPFTTWHPRVLPLSLRAKEPLAPRVIVLVIKFLSLEICLLPNQNKSVILTVVNKLKDRSIRSVIGLVLLPGVLFCHFLRLINHPKSL